jgi:serine/threonine-protein kinase
MGESAPQRDTLIGKTIGNYEVLEKLGEGGMGAVYLAQHPRIGKKVALKVLHSEFATDTSIVDRFFTEAKAVNDIGHPNIIDITDFGELTGEDGKPMVYFFMEYLDGEAVSELVARESPLPAERVFAIGAQIADALAASHREGVVHRDLKPDNIFLTQRGRRNDVVKVLDFGIAKLTGDQPGSRRTRTGVVIGTPYYMSPEQCEGKGNIDQRTDVYALGVVLFEMLTKRVPFDGEGYGEILVQHLTQLPPRPSQLVPGMSPYVEVVVLKALEKHRDDRYASMEEMLAALSDPVGFVNARGGPHAFLSGGASLRLDRKAEGGYVSPTTQSGRSVHTPPPVYTPAPADQSAPFYIGGGPVRPDQTPHPGYATPAPGYATPAPGYAPTPTPVGVYEDLDRPPKSKAPLYVALGVVAAGAALTLVLTMGGGGEPSAAPEPAAQPEPPAVQPTPPTVEPTPVPPQPPKPIDLRLVSKPVGAQVFVGDETASRCTTPCSTPVAAGNQEVAIVLRKDGFEDEIKRITPDRDAVIDVNLTEKKKSRSSRDSSSKSKTTRKNKRTKVGDDILVPDL